MKSIVMVFALCGFLSGLAPAAPTVSNVVASITSRVAGPRGMITRTFDVTFDLANTNGQSCRIFPGVRGVARNPVLADEGPYLWYTNLTGDTASMPGTGKHITIQIKDTAGEFDNVRVKVTAWDRTGWPPFPNRTMNPRWHSWAQDITRAPAHPRSADFVKWWKSNSSGALLSVYFDYKIATVMGNHPAAVPAYGSGGGNSDKIPVPWTAVALGDPVDVFTGSSPCTYQTYNGDCIVEIVDVENWVNFSTYMTQKIGSGPLDFGVDCESVFPFYSDVFLKKGAGSVPIAGSKPSVIGAYRNIGWTSSSASGLSYTAGFIFLRDVNEGEIQNALRIETAGSRAYYVHPASHFAGSKTDSFAAPMGLRFRLKPSYDINSRIPLTGTPGTAAYRDCRAARILLRGLQKYGTIVEDNAGNGGYLYAETDNSQDLKWANLMSGGSLAGYLYTGDLSFDDFEVVDWNWQYQQYAHYDSLYFNR
jgi:hypothetical protein